MAALDDRPFRQRFFPLLRIWHGRVLGRDVPADLPLGIAGEPLVAARVAVVLGGPGSERGAARNIQILELFHWSDLSSCCKPAALARRISAAGNLVFYL